MVWPLLIAAGSQLMNSASQSNAERRAGKQQNQLNKEANLRNALDVAQEISSVQVQQGVLRRTASAQRSAAQRIATLGQGSAEAQAGAIGVRGASVDAVLGDIDRELGWAKAELEQDQELEQFNLSTRLRTAVSGAIANLYGYQSVASTGDIMRGAIVNAGLNAAGQYASNYFQFGGGTSSNFAQSSTMGSSTAGYTGADFSTWSANQ
jgi:hypothetical protein